MSELKELGLPNIGEITTFKIGLLDEMHPKIRNVFLINGSKKLKKNMKKSF